MVETIVKKKARRPKDRQATEQTLIAACETILLRDGPGGMGVNKVVEEAGVGKDLIYRYFGGLPGLIQRWVETTAYWPSTDELTSGEESFRLLATKDKIKTVWINYLRALRKRPIMMNILASDIMKTSDVTAALESASDRLAKDIVTLIAEIPKEDLDDIVDISLVMYCAINYVAVRSLHTPHCFALNFQEDAAWQKMELVILKVLDRYLPNT